MKESPLKQTIGPKKYEERVRKAWDFYDKYKAGKTDPKTGIYYNHIDFTGKNQPKIINSTVPTPEIGHLTCSCGARIPINKHIMSYSCLGCFERYFFTQEFRSYVESQNDCRDYTEEYKNA